VTGNPRNDLLRSELPRTSTEGTPGNFAPVWQVLLVNTNFNHVNASTGAESLRAVNPGEEPKFGKAAQGMLDYARRLRANKQAIFRGLSAADPEPRAAFPDLSW